MNPPEKAFRAIAENFALSCLEPEPIRFTGAHKKEVPRVKAAIQVAGDEQAFQIDTPVNRNAFLCGCLEYTFSEHIEHLIVGYGFRHGSTSKIDYIHHVRGDARTVAIPGTVERSIRLHEDSNSRAEAVVFHNHPVNPLNLFLDNLPLTSGADRRALENLALAPYQMLRGLLGGGRVLCYLGENGSVKQFRLPPLQSMLWHLQAPGISR